MFLARGVIVFFWRSRIDQCQDDGNEDEVLVRHLTRGLPMTGETCDRCERWREEEWQQGWAKEEILAPAILCYTRMLAKVRETEWSKDMHPQHWDDINEGFMSTTISDGII